ncbi:amino acid adenylation domain-containing protein [Sphaerisporangium sp. NPDC005289]|uniref:non-ribosomal peptide synthetase n=1 Tax=Sphaerisporangium sp. NPDC005289 TaxID=3155247 RepID=UPI0033A0D197
MTTSFEASEAFEALEGFPLSPQQRDTWVRAGGEGAPAPSIVCAVRIDGDLDRGVLRRAIAELVRRHEILRTGFHAVPGLTLPVQVISATAGVPLEDLPPAAPLADEHDDAMALRSGTAPGGDDDPSAPWAGTVPDGDDPVARWAGRPLDLTAGGLLSVAVRRESARRHTLLLRLPLLCADGPAMERLVHELAALYRGEPLSDAADRWQYADLSEWLNDLPSPPEAGAAPAAAGPPRLPFLRTVAVPDPVGAPGTGEVAVEIGAAAWSRARLAAERLEVPARALLAASWAATLYRYTRQQSMVLTVAADGRDTTEARDVVGPLTHDAPLTLEVPETLAFSDLARETARLDAAPRPSGLSGATPSGQAAPADGPGGTPAPVGGLTETAGRAGGRTDPAGPAGETASPAHPVGFAYQAVTTPSAGEPGFTIAAIDQGPGRHPLELRCVEPTGTVRLTLHHCPRRYDRADVAGLGAALTALIAHASAEPGTPVGLLRLTGEATGTGTAVGTVDGGDTALAERPSRRHAGADPGPAREPSAARVAGDPELVHELFERHAATRPDAVAVVCEEERLTYAELRDHARRVAARLADAGVLPGDLVPLFADRGLDAIAGVLGILLAGAAYVPVEPVTPAKRLAFLLDDIGAGPVLTQAHLASRLPAGARAVHLDLPHAPGAAAPDRSLPRPERHGPAYVIYTSGTTGTPKGVVIEHDQLAHYVAGLTAALGAPVAGGFAMVSSLASDLGNTALFHALCNGGTLHLITKDRASDPDGLAAYLRREPVDRMKIVPSHLRALLDAATRPSDLLPRAALVLGGEPCQPDLVDRVESLAPSCAVVNHYGPTETTVGATTHAVTADGMDPRCRTVPIGRPLGRTRVLVLDPSLTPVPDWVPGEAYIAGPQVARGYLNRPGLTAERFLPDHSGGDPDGRMYRTGDRVRRLPGGAHEFLGRVDDQVKVRGFRVEPAEVEAVVRTHPRVRDVAVLAREDAAGDRQLAAYVVVRRACGADGPGEVPGLREFLLERLPDHMVPATVETMDALPLTPNGKVDRAALLARAPVAGARERQVVEPRDEEEARLLAIWRDTLRTRPLGVTDDFFEAGGNSLLAVRLIAQIRRRTGHNLPLASLFTDGTVAAMARLIRTAGQDAGIAGDGDGGAGPVTRDPIAVPIQALGARRPFFCVHAGGGTTLGYLDLARNLGADQPFHGMQSLGLDGVQEPLPDLTEMATRYVECMRRIQPEGPYLIGGWCLGGIIAFEMTRVLRAQGQRTGVLVLIDSESPATAAAGLRAEEAAGGPGADLDDTTLLKRFAWHFGIEDTRADLAELTEEQRLAHLLDLARRHDVLPADAGPEQLGWLLRVYKNNILAVHDYLRAFTPGETLDHPVVLYRPVRELDAGQDAAFGWTGLAGARLSVELVPGDHHSVMRPPAVAVLAERLRTLLGTCQEGWGS